MLVWSKFNQHGASLRPSICSSATALKMRPASAAFLGMPEGPASNFLGQFGRLENPDTMNEKNMGQPSINEFISCFTKIKHKQGGMGQNS